MRTCSVKNQSGGTTTCQDDRLTDPKYLIVVRLNRDSVSILTCSSSLICSNYTIAHLKHKCFKLTKDTMSVSGRRIQDQVKQKLSISPAITGNSPAPSPASIASTGSVVSLKCQSYSAMFGMVLNISV